MSTPAGIPDPRAVRLRHYQGQRLLADDLQDEHDNLAWLRGLHVVALHDTWGIAQGLAVLRLSGDLILVGQGVAYDYKGRTILLSHDRLVPGPLATFPGSAPGDAYDLVVGYATELRRRDNVPGPAPCPEPADPPGREQPAFGWRRPGEMRLGLEVPVARADVDPSTALDTTVRRYARPQTRPHVAAGITPPDQPWRSWTDVAARQRLGFQTRVRTPDAGFLRTPHFFATLQVDKPADLAGGGRASFLDLVVLSRFVLQPTPTGFLFRVAIYGTDPGFRLNPALPFTPLKRNWTYTSPLRISWVGVEPSGGCAAGSILLKRPGRHQRRRHPEPFA